MPYGYKIVNNEIVFMTLEEQLKAGVIDSVQFEQLKRNEIISQIRAIENTDEYKRKVRLAMTGDEIAKQWLVEKEAEIQVLRDGLV